jgi:hypothetical protein
MLTHISPNEAGSTQLIQPRLPANEAKPFDHTPTAIPIPIPLLPPLFRRTDGTPNKFLQEEQRNTSKIESKKQERKHAT